MSNVDGEDDIPSLAPHASVSIVKVKDLGKVEITHDVNVAKDSVEAGFGVWDLCGKALFTGHSFWVLKELLWVLLLSYGAFAAGGLAVVFVGFSVFKRLDGGLSGQMYDEVRAEVLIGVIHFLWLIANVLDMFNSLIFDVPPSEIPGYAEDLVAMCRTNAIDDYKTAMQTAGTDDVVARAAAVKKYDNDLMDCDDTNDTLTIVVRVLYLIPISIWVLAATYLTYEYFRPPRLLFQGHAMQTILLDGGWLAFWVIKDYAWTYESDGFPFAVCAWFLHFVLLIMAFLVASSATYLWDGLQQEEIDRIRKLSATMDYPMASYVFWSIGALMWLLLENAFDDDLTFRYITAAVFFLSFLLFIKGKEQARAKGNSLLLIHKRRVEGDNEDDRPALHVETPNKSPIDQAVQGIDHAVVGSRSGE